MEVINIFNHFVTNFQNGSYKRQSKHGTRNTGITILYIYEWRKYVQRGRVCFVHFLIGLLFIHSMDK